jgi:hypothetical protein
MIAYLPESNTVRTVYEFCYPQLTSAQIKKIKDKPIWKSGLGDEVGDMTDDIQFLAQKMKNKLAIAQKMIVKVKNSKFQHSLISLSIDVKKLSRVVVFTNNEFNSKFKGVDFKDSKVYIYQKKIASKKRVASAKTFVQNSNGNFMGIRNRNFSSTEVLNYLAYHELNFKVLINSKKVPATFYGNIGDNGIIENGWLNIRGVIKTPLEGNVRVRGQKIIALNSKVPSTNKTNKNIVLKGDKFKLKSSGNKYSGKYYNDAYMFDNGSSSYFEYLVK